MSEINENNNAEPEVFSNSPEEVPETVSEPEVVEDSTGIEPSETEDEELPPHLQRKIGKIISKERKRLEAKFTRQQSHQPMGTAPEGTIFDHQIGEYVDINSVPGQMAWREQLAQQKREKDRMAHEQASRQAEYEELTDKLTEGHVQYENFQKSLQNFSDLATQAMADALTGTDAPAAIINYLGDKKGEIQRISRLPFKQQEREIFRIEQNLLPRKKLVSNAPAPVPKLKAVGGAVGTSRDQMSIEQRKSYWEKQLNSR